MQFLAASPLSRSTIPKSPTFLLLLYIYLLTSYPIFQSHIRAIQPYLLFREPAPSSTVEAEWNEDGDEDEGEEGEEDSHDENVGEDKMSWDDLLIEDEDDDSMEVVIESDS